MSVPETTLRMLNATPIIAANSHIGEAPLWDSVSNRLVWVDHAEGEVSIAEQSNYAWRRSAAFKGGGHIAAALPRRSGGFIVVQAASLSHMDEAGACDAYRSAPFDVQHFRFNEAKADASGRIWAGAMANDLSANGTVFCLTPEGDWRTVVTDMRLPNGMDWSPDGSRFYLIDSIAQTLDVFDCDLANLMLGRRQTLIDFTADQGSPNGMCVDTEGDLWVALTGSGEVRNYSPDGVLKTIVNAAARCVTSCAFGGSEGRMLFITSRSGTLPDFAREFGLGEEGLSCAGEHAGALFACEPGVAGPAAHPVDFDGVTP